MPMTNIFGAEFRRVDNREYLGQPAIVAIAARSYDTTAEDLWNAVTTPARLARWFGKVDGDLKLGGRYHITGNASGTITRCDAPRALDLTWEFGGGTSWVTLRLEPQGSKARLTLEHIAHRGGIGEEHLKQYGPGAVGIGWDLSLHGLQLHLSDPGHFRDHEAAEAWTQTDEGKAFMRGSGEAWGQAHAASGEDPAEARAKAQRTIAAYTGG
jgi:uncharacterized protein YndB with AHSA1/START domain